MLENRLIPKPPKVHQVTDLTDHLDEVPPPGMKHECYPAALGSSVPMIVGRWARNRCRWNGMFLTGMIGTRSVREFPLGALAHGNTLFPDGTIARLVRASAFLWRDGIRAEADRCASSSVWFGSDGKRRSIGRINQLKTALSIRIAPIGIGLSIWMTSPATFLPCRRFLNPADSTRCDFSNNTTHNRQTPASRVRVRFCRTRGIQRMADWVGNLVEPLRIGPLRLRYFERLKIAFNHSSDRSGRTSFVFQTLTSSSPVTSPARRAILLSHVSEMPIVFMTPLRRT